MEGSLGLIFESAEDDGKTRPYAGLALLSQVCAEQGMPNVHAMNPILLLHPAKRVGLRIPVNEPRQKITLLSPSTQHSCRSVYEYYCREYGIHPNSKLVKTLNSAPNDYSASEISTADNYVGDRGLLPVLEVVRLSPNLKQLSFPENGLRNSAVEWLVHCLMDESCQCARTVESVDVSKNRITLGAAKLLTDLARKRPNILRINVDDTRIDDTMKKRLTEALRANAASQAPK